MPGPSSPALTLPSPADSTATAGSPPSDVPANRGVDDTVDLTAARVPFTRALRSLEQVRRATRMRPPLSHELRAEGVRSMAGVGRDSQLRARDAGGPSRGAGAARGDPLPRDPRDSAGGGQGPAATDGRP